MGVIRLPLQHANNWAARNVHEALQTLGEECIILSMFHVVTDVKTQPRCQCFDEDYKATSDYDCPNCFGTTFVGGVKQASRSWSLFTDQVNDEKQAKRGEWQPEDKKVQLENYPILMQHDYLIRVFQWDNNHAPVVLGGRYGMDAINELTVRTGARFGQQGVDKYGQFANVHVLPTNHPIHKYNVPVGVPIPRIDGMAR